MSTENFSNAKRQQDISKDDLHQSLRTLLEQVRGQLVVLTKENQTKEKQNQEKEKELELLKAKVKTLEQLTESKIESERTLRMELTQLRKEYDTQAKQNNVIQAKLLSQLSKSRNENQTMEEHHRNEIEKAKQQTQLESEQWRRKYESLVIENQDLNHQYNTLVQNQQEKQQLANAEKEQMQQSMAHWQKEYENGLQEIKQLQEQIHSCNEQMTKMKSEQIHLQTQCEMFKNNNTTTTNNVQYLKKYIQHLENQFTTVKAALDGSSDGAKNATVQVGIAKTPEPKMPSSVDTSLSEEEMKDWNQWKEKHTIDISKVQQLPKKALLIERELKATQEQLRQEREKMSEQMLQWKNRVEQQNTTAQNLHQRATELENMLNELSTENDELKQEIQQMNIENMKRKKAESAHEIFLQMKAEEENKKTQELQKHINLLQSELTAAQQRANEWRLQMESREEKLQDERCEYQREMNMLKDKMMSVSTLSQEEIQQAFHVTISELKDMLQSTTTRTPRGTKASTAVSQPTTENHTDHNNVQTSAAKTSQSTTNGDNMPSSKLVQDLLQSLEEEKAHRIALEEELQAHRRLNRQRTEQKLNLVNELDNENHDIDHFLAQSQIFNDTNVKDAQSMRRSTTPDFATNHRRSIETPTTTRHHRMWSGSPKLPHTRSMTPSLPSNRFAGESARHDFDFTYSHPHHMSNASRESQSWRVNDADDELDELTKESEQGGGMRRGSTTASELRDDIQSIHETQSSDYTINHQMTMSGNGIGNIEKPVELESNEINTPVTVVQQDQDIIKPNGIEEGSATPADKSKLSPKVENSNTPTGNTTSKVNTTTGNTATGQGNTESYFGWFKYF